MANCASQPGPTRFSGQAMIAALLMARWMSRPEASNRSANAATLSRSLEVELVDLDPSSPASASRATSGRRAGTTTCAPAPTSALVVSMPSPE